MKRNPHSPAPRTLARRAGEVYCRRDNRVYPVCPHVAAGSQCRCLYEVETADALFESETVEQDIGRRDVAESRPPVGKIAPLPAGH